MELAFISAAPFALALLLALPPARAVLGKTAQTWLSALLMAALFFWLCGALPRLQAEGPLFQALPWLPSVGISLSFYLDGLALLFALIISGIGALIFLYAGAYFDETAEYNRFVILLLAFASAMQALVGIRPPGPREGCLQDIHWAMGAFGYFPTYTLGALMAAQLAEAMRAALPDLDRDLARGDFGPLVGWLRRNVHARGAFDASSDALLEQATGRPLDTGAFTRHIARRYAR